jgi:hypothetical protein
MRRLLLCCGVDGTTRGLAALRRFADERKPDAILFAGGMLSPQRAMTPYGSSAWGVTREDEQFLYDFAAALDGLGVFCAVIPGPNFEPLDQFYRWALSIELKFPHIHMAHATLVEERDVAVCGLGVTVAEEALMREDSWSRIRAQYFLRPLRASVKPHKILLLPEPPAGDLGGADGNPVLGDLIDGVRPGLCVVAGSTQRRGVQRIASTLIVNPGHLAEDSAALFDWDKSSNDPVEFLGR